MSSSDSELSSVPPAFMGMWRYWDVKDEIAEDLELDSPGLESATGLFLGFGSGKREDWAVRLPELKKLKYLVSWTGNNPQSFFDSIASMPWLKRLCLGRLSAKDISAISNLRKLEYLCIHQLAGPETIQPIANLEKLFALEIGLNSKINDLECFRQNKLRRLRSIVVYSNKSKISVPSVEPLAAISTLEYISIPTVRADDAKLHSLAVLPDLKFLHLAENAWPQTEIDDMRAKGVSVKLGF